MTGATRVTNAPSIAHGAVVPPLAQGEDVLSRYERWVTDTPDAPAVEDGAHTWTFREIDAIARKVADRLKDRVAAGDIVAVCLDRSAALVAVAIAMARLRAVYLPLGPTPGARRLDDLTRELRVTAVVGPPDNLPGRGERVSLAVPAEGANGVPAVLAEAVAPAPDATPAPEGTLYAVLTSGSTGRPKAVAVGTASLTNLVHWYHELTGLGPGHRMSLLMAVPFDPHLGDLWGGLALGATLAVAPDRVRYSSEELIDWYRTARVTVSVLATPMAEPVLGGDWPKDLPLRHLLIGGDRLRAWPKPDVTARVHNVYGPAETTINVTAATLEPAFGKQAPPIGAPIQGVTVCVVDEAGRIVERGQPGELLVGGRCLALGYLDETLTRQRFVPAPEGAGVDRVYRTGDKVRMLPGGDLEFLGRLDDQLKISGVRIEPAEVEAVLERDPRVARAVVAVRRHEGRAGRLVAFVHAAGQERIEVPELLDQAAAALPAQAVPGAVHLVDHFPLNVNGKVDRAALLAASPAAPVAELTTETQVRLAELWRELLNVDAVGPDSRFFDMGGNSMHAFSLVRDIKRAFDVELSMKAVMSLRTLRDLAAAIDAERELTLVAAAPHEESTVTEW